MTTPPISRLFHVAALVAIASLLLAAPALATGPSIQTTVIIKAPRDFRVGTITANSVELRWVDEAINESYYRLQVTPQGGSTYFRTLGRNSTAYTLKDLAPGYQLALSISACVTVHTYSKCGFESQLQVTSQVVFRVELSWGVKACDMDLYVRTPDGALVGFSDDTDPNMAGEGADDAVDGRLFAAPYTTRNNDDGNFGPSIESALIGPTQSGAYKIAVHYYNDCTDDHVTDVALAGTGAQVRIYRGFTLLKTLTVPATGPNDADWWYAADLNQSGQVTPVNTLSSTNPI